jgi:hypothetical protein
MKEKVCTRYDPDCYGCQLRSKDIALSASATPSRQNSVPPRAADPAWERGVAGEHRPDGSWLPYLNSNLDPMPIKEYGENRHQVDEGIRRNKSPEQKVSAP